MATKNIVVADLETDGGLDEKYNLHTDWFETGEASVIQYACIAIDVNKIEYVPNSEFFTWVLPEDIEDDDYIEKHQRTLDWHANLRNISVEDFVKQIKDNGISQKTALKQFSEHVCKYGNGPKTQPGAGGQNIRGFDTPILEILCDKYKVKYPFSKKWQDHWDLMDVTSKWFCYAEQAPRGVGMDELRRWFRVEDKQGQAHSALTDIHHEGYFIKRFMNFHKYIIQNTPTLNKRPTKKVVL